MNFSKLMLSGLSILFISQSLMATPTLRLNRGQFDTKKLAQMWSTQGLPTAATEYIVQFSSSVTEKNRQDLLKLQTEIFGYLPDDAYVVRMNSDQLAKAKAISGLYSIIPYHPQFKLNKNIGSLSVFNAQQAHIFIARVFKSSEVEQIAQSMEKRGAIVQLASDKSILFSAPQAIILQLANITGVEHIQLQPKFESMNFQAQLDDHAASETPAPPAAPAGDYKDLDGSESGTKVLQFPAAWNRGFTGAQQVAAMSDTGLDTGNKDSIAPDFQGAVISGYPIGLFSKSWEDPMGHGTHVAGSIIGRSPQSGGILKGGAFDASFVAESLWSPMLDNLSVPSKMGEMIDKAYKDGARVHSNSWGSPQNFGAYDNFAVQVDEYIQSHPDIVVLFAAGNSGVDANKDGRIDANSICSPGTAKNIITVGASENVTKTGGIQVPISKLRTAKDTWGAEPIYSSLISDNANGIAMFSSRGPTTDGRTKPELVSPGTNILSTRSHLPDSSALWGAYNSDYAWSGGTSMATPLAAGAVTVTRQYLTQKGFSNPTAALLKAYLMHTADDLFPGQFGEIGVEHGQELATVRPNTDEGYGRINMDRATTAASQAKLIDQTKGIAQGSKEQYRFEVKRSGRLLANLVWTDAPGSPNAGQALVNDLDLVLVDQSGREIKTMNDHINNNEIIEMNLPAGQYQLEVRAGRVPQPRQGGQSFALVYSVIE